MCFEMALVSILHIWAYPSGQYRLDSENHLANPHPGHNSEAPKYKGGPLGLYALLDALKPWDIVKHMARSTRWMIHGVKERHSDSSYQPAEQYAIERVLTADDDDDPCRDQRSSFTTKVAEDGRGLFKQSVSYVGIT